ncbi:hypothetical protein Pint_25498 [Pistacia integerrima]|uniref:Uncharacterized protein n=1 Tax=Pistacia integerrima TaxID=434235 RepID=A0ACC0YE92_9ROSI|nr:hypothetical protein Pint_25498 [Pistacia integerrima]
MDQSLIAVLSRDLLEDFLPFLPRIVDSLVSLLESGADREPEIVEQVNAMVFLNLFTYFYILVLYYDVFAEISHSRLNKCAQGIVQMETILDQHCICCKAIHWNRCLVTMVTLKLRYYPKDYVQEFMAEATSFLLRKDRKQLKSGIRKIMLEVVKKPSPERKSGVSGLLYHVMRGTASRFHSEAEQVLRLLLSNSILSIGDKLNQGKLFSYDKALFGQYTH